MPSKKKTKSSLKSTEFWLSAAAVIVGLLLSSGILGDGTPAMRYVGAAASILASLGYTAARTKVKSDAKKPGFQTTEFWINAASGLSGILMTAGVGAANVVNEAATAAGDAVAADPNAGYIGVGLAALNAAIYAGSRGKLKGKESK
jgi:hypothetical protein